MMRDYKNAVDCVRRDGSITMSLKELRDIFFRERMSTKLGDEMRSRLLVDDIGTATPIPPSEKEDVILFDVEQFKPLFDFVDRIRASECSCFDEFSFKGAIKFLREHFPSSFQKLSEVRSRQEKLEA